MTETYPQDYYNLIRHDALNVLPQNQTFERVLDVGCGEGLTSEHLKQARGATYVTGIEVVAEAAEQAKQRLDRVLQVSAESPDLPLDPESFDLLLCLDVLEHLNDPWATLQRYANFLKRGGIALISLPNVGNWKILLNLLRGKWHYVDHGIMDSTHLRFFTVNSAVEMVRDAGLEIKTLKRSMGPELKVANALTLGLLKNLFTYHIYIVAQKS